MNFFNIIKGIKFCYYFFLFKKVEEIINVIGGKCYLYWGNCIGVLIML